MSEKEYIEIPRASDGIKSSHYEELASHEYGHEDEQGYTYSDIALGSIYRYWHGELQNEHRTERSKEVCNKIAERALFELAFRNKTLEELEELYGLVEA